MIKKLFFAHGAMFLAIIALSALILTKRQNALPPRPDIDKLLNAAAAAPSRDNSAESQGDRYPNLGNAALFATLYPRPTPVPTPVPTQKPPPNLEKATASWKLSATLPGGQAMFEDSKNKEEWPMSVGEVKSIRLGQEQLDVKLESVNEKEFSVEISFTDATGATQKRTLKLFD